MANKQQKKQDISFRINDEIPYTKDVRIVGENIESQVVSYKLAKNMANEMELDMVEINSSIYPPIIRLCRYDKYIYDLKKNAKKNKQQAQQTKEVQLRVNIASHDLETKANQAKKFIENGDKVKVVLTMKGRELSRREENKRSILEFIVLMDEIAVPESMPRDEGNKTIVILKKKK